MDIGSNAASILQFQDLKHIELAMKVVSLMCDGQFYEMQNYFHKQKKSISSINMVGEVVSFLQQIFQSRKLNPVTIGLLHQLLQTLIEMSVGNYINQEAIFNKQIMSIINYILHLDITTEIPVEELNTEQTDYDQVTQQQMPLQLRKKALDLKSSAVELLTIILEETSLKMRNLARQIAGGLDINAIKHCLVDFDKLSRDRELKKEEYDDNAERALFRTYHVLMRLKDYGIETQGRFNKLVVSTYYL